MRGVFGIGNSSSGEVRGNILFGGRGKKTRTLQSLRSVLNYSADLIWRLFFALRLSYEHNRALNETIRNMQAHHEAYVLRTVNEKEIAKWVLNYYRSLRHDAEASALYRILTGAAEYAERDMQEVKRTSGHARGLVRASNASRKDSVGRSGSCKRRKKTMADLDIFIDKVKHIYLPKMERPPEEHVHARADFDARVLLGCMNSSGKAGSLKTRIKRVFS